MLLLEINFILSYLILKVRASNVFMLFSVDLAISDFLLFVKNGFVVGVLSLKVTAHHSNKAGSSYEKPHCPSVWRYTIDLPSSTRQTHTRCTLSCTAAVRQGGREGGRGGREEGGREGGRDRGRET